MYVGEISLLRTAYLFSWKFFFNFYNSNYPFLVLLTMKHEKCASTLTIMIFLHL